MSTKALHKLAELPGLPADKTAVGWDGPQDRALLRERQNAWRSALKGSLDGRVALYLEDGFEFCAALLAAWAEGLTVLLPGDNTPNTCDALKAQASLWAGDLPLAGSRRPQGPGPEEPLRPFPPVPVIVFTSGSTGLPQAIPKPVAVLDAELDALERQFGAVLHGTSILSTVSHQHIYGLLFKALWPLAAGRPSLSQRLGFPEEVQARLTQRSCTLVSSPAFLKRLEDDAPNSAAWARAHGHLRAVFSSGGPLGWSAAQRCASLLGRAPFEVFGSSETGGVAWRQRRREDGPWAPLPGVQVRVDMDGSLALLSPHTGSPDWVATADRAEILGDGFRLLGRADRVVKVEEKRVSLSALERDLARHEAVLEARVLLLPGLRECLGAVLALKAGGPQDHSARLGLIQALREHLARSFERVALPRRWRFVSALPMNAQGKTTQAELLSLFADPAHVKEPELLSHRFGDDEAELELYLPPELWCFQGHFPGVALLPGVVQLQWAVQQASRCLGAEGPFKALSALKFTKPVFPGQTLTLSLKAVSGGFQFEYRSEAGRHSMGKVLRG